MLLLQYLFKACKHKDHLTLSKNYYLKCVNIHVAWNGSLKYIPEFPDVSIAVPKKSIYSVNDAYNKHMLPIHPPAFMNTQ